MVVYPLAHVGIDNIAAMLCPIDSRIRGDVLNVPAHSEPAKATDGRTAHNEIIEKSDGTVRPLLC